MRVNEFQCAMCNRIFNKEWTDEEATEEAQKLFGKHPKDWKDDIAVVCDDCFNKIHPLKYPKIVNEVKQKI